MDDCTARIGDIGLVPVVTIDDAGDAGPLGRALIEGSLPIAEVTFRTAAAGEAIRTLVGDFPDMLVGAGTILNEKSAAEAIAAGAAFIVTPGLNVPVIEYCRSHGVPVYPGTSCATHLETAVLLNLDLVKFFPAEASGGCAAIKALSGPFPGLRFMPTGGVTRENLRSYLRLPMVEAAGGSWMVDRKLIRSGDFAEIGRRAAEAVATMVDFSIAHVGINAPSEAQANETADAISKALGLPSIDRGGAVFSGVLFEILKKPGKGSSGHIGVGTPDIRRAMAFVRRNGFLIPEENIIRKDGSIRAAYLDGEFGGFALHLLQTDS